MRRRELLRTFLLILGDVRANVPEGSAPRCTGQVHPRVALAPPVDGEALSDGERETLLAFAEVLVEGRPLSPSERETVLSHLADRVGAWEGALGLYRDTARLLDRLAGAAFSTLGFQERSELVTREGLGPSRGRIGRADDAARLVRTRVTPDLIVGYYGSSAGWAVVGYAVFPGRCGDLTRYTRPEP